MPLDTYQSFSNKLSNESFTWWLEGKGMNGHKSVSGQKDTSGMQAGYK